MTEPTVSVARFAEFEANFDTGELRKHGVRVRVPEQSMAILRALVERPGELVTREQMRDRLWPSGTFVDFEHGLNAAIRRLRDVLGDTAREPRYVETLPRRGYRFIGELAASDAPAARTRQPEREWPRPAPPSAPFESEPSRPTATGPAGRRWLVPALLVAGVAALLLLVAITLGGRLFAPSPVAPLKPVPFTSLPGQEVVPVFSPDGSRLAFAWAESTTEGGGRFDLYSKVVGSERLLRLTQRPANWISPAWSPDGRWIAFSRWRDEESGIYVVPALGGEERKLATVGYEYPPMMGIAWTPDGRGIVFVGEGSALYSLSVDTLKVVPLQTATRCLLAGYPSFSPDGRRLAFTCGSDYGLYGLYVVPATGGRADRVLQMTGNPEGLAWRGDGTLIFSNNPGIEEGRLGALTLSTREVTDLPLSEDARFPAVSPSGGQLAFARGFDTVNVWKVDPREGASPRPFILSTRVQGNARFSPDGQRIVFDSTRSGAREVWLAAADGSNPVQATMFKAGISGSPTWCADSQRIAFDSRVNGPVSVYVEDVRERVPRPLKTDLSQVQLPSWSRDCRSLYVVAGAAKDALYRVPAAGGRAELLYKGIAINASEAADGSLFFADAFENAQIRRLAPGQREAEVVRDMPRVRFASAWQLTAGGIDFVEAASRHAAVLDYYAFATRSTHRLAALRRQVVPWTALSVSPLDGSVIYSQVDDRQSDIMMAEYRR